MSNHCGTTSASSLSQTIGIQPTVDNGDRECRKGCFATAGGRLPLPIALAYVVSRGIERMIRSSAEILLRSAIASAV